MHRDLIIFFIAGMFCFNSCATRYMSMVEPSKLTGNTKPHTIWTTGYLVDIPINYNIRSAELCPEGRIGGIQMTYPSTPLMLVNISVCILTLWLMCPHTIGVECID